MVFESPTHFRPLKTYPPGNEHIPLMFGIFESMIFRTSPGGICDRFPGGYITFRSQGLPPPHAAIPAPSCAFASISPIQTMHANLGSELELFQPSLPRWKLSYKVVSPHFFLMVRSCIGGGLNWGEIVYVQQLPETNSSPLKEMASQKEMNHHPTIHFSRERLVSWRVTYSQHVGDGWNNGFLYILYTSFDKFSSR